MIRSQSELPEPFQQSELPELSELFQVTIPLEIRVKAEELSLHQSQVHKIERVYLNTLGIFAVNSYLESIGWSSNLQASDSHSSILQTLMDIADIYIPSYGKIECCVLLQGKDYVAIPPEVWSDRIAYVVVEINQSLNLATLLGFVSQVSQGKLSLSQLKPLALLPAHLSQQKRIVPQHIPNLSNWFTGTLDQGWQKLEKIFPPTSTLKFRSAQGLANSKTEHLSAEISRTKVISLLQSTGQNIKNINIALILNIQPQDQQEFEISMLVCNEQLGSHLPEGLELIIQDEALQPVMIAQANQTETIEFCFSGSQGESFSIEISLDQQIQLESFII